MLRLPTKVNFDICTFCNHQCTFCSNPDKRTLKNQVSLAQFTKVMDNVTQYLSISELGLSAKGEVLINKDLIGIIKMAKSSYDIPYVYLSTNGSLLYADVLEDMLQAKLDSIKFSINGLSEQEYFDIHQKNDFLIVLQHLKQTIYQKKIAHPELKIFISVINDACETVINQFYADLLGEDIQYINGIFKYKISYTPKFSHFSIDKSKLKTCPLAVYEVYIDSDCRLGLCCKDYFHEFDFGSLLEEDFLKLYMSDSMVALRNMHLNSSFEASHFCTKCLMFDGAYDE